VVMLVSIHNLYIARHSMATFEYFLLQQIDSLRRLRSLKVCPRRHVVSDAVRIAVPHRTSADKAGIRSGARA
jgi:hypothetical protein